MAKVVWKTVNGNGPYAYLQKSERNGNSTKSVHVAYLGTYGNRDLFPTDAYTLPDTIASKANQKNVSIPNIPKHIWGKLSDAVKLKINPEMSLEESNNDAKEAGIDAKEAGN